MGGRKQIPREVESGIIIIGEGKTEHYYFKHLKKIYNFRCTIKPRFCNNTSINQFADTIKQLLKGQVTIICVFDADVTRRNEKENQKLKQLQKQYANKKNVIFCDSSPAIEYWFLLHYKDTCRAYSNNRQLEDDLLKFLMDYDKTEEFLKNEKWVKDMCSINGSLEAAIQRAEKYNAGNAASYSNVYKAIYKLKETWNNNSMSIN